MLFHQHWLTRNRLLAANGIFTVYATALAVITGQADRTWAIWAAVGYGVTTLVIWLTRRRNVPVIWPVLISLAGALAAPVAWLVTRVAPTPEVQVISRSAGLLLQHGTPYLTTGQLADWLSYNPYLPVMALFGLPRALGATGILGDPRLWLSLTSIALIWAAFTVAAPHRRCAGCRRGVLLSSLFLAASPVIAFPLTVGITDPPVIALMLLTLALIARPSGWFRAAVALGVACAMKATAWPAVPVFAAMLAARDAARSAWRFAGVAFGLAVLLSVASAPAALGRPWAFMQNTVLFPLGLSKYKTPAASPLPGHLLATTGIGGALGRGRAAGRGRARLRRVAGGPAPGRRARRGLAPRARPRGDVHAGAGHPVGVLPLPDRAGRVAAADPAAGPGNGTGPRRAVGSRAGRERELAATSWPGGHPAG